MSVASRKWDVAFKRSFSGGEILTAGYVHFRFRNVESGTTTTLAFYGGGVGVSLVPISISEDFSPKFKRFTSRMPMTFEQFHHSKASLISGSAAGFHDKFPFIPIGGAVGGVLMLEIDSDGHSYLPPVLRIVLTSLSPPSSMNYTTTNLSLDMHRGLVRIKYDKVEPLDLPVDDPPIPPRPYPVIPYAPPIILRPPKKITLEEDILFGFDSYRIKNTAEAELYTLVLEIKKRVRPNVLIEGHTDSVGRASYNMGLSKRRAEAVKSWLIEAGAPGAHGYKVVGHGESKPIADNSTPSGRAKNRRVDITIN